MFANQICRLCLTDKLELISVFDNNIDEKLNIHEIIDKYLHVQLLLEDQISVYICWDCWGSLKDFHIFYESITSAQNDVLKIDDAKSTDTDDYRVSCIETIEIKCESEETEVDEADENDASTNEKDVLELVHFESVGKDTAFGDIEYFSPAKRRKSQKITETSTTPTAQVVEQKSLETLLQEDEMIKEFFNVECEICGESFEKFHLLKTHYKETHKKTGYLPCCGKRFFSRSEALHHVKRHSDPDFFKCEVCDKSFVDLKGLRGHMFIHAPEEERKFKCSSCPKSFVKQYMLKSHEVIHVPVDDRKFTCDICNRTYASKQLLHGHIKSAHQKQTYMCEICAKSFKDKIWFQTHVREHNVVEPRVQCDICSQWYKDKKSLKKHLQKHEEAKLEIFCDICGKQSPSFGAMRAHKRNAHGGEKDRKYKCTICVKAFKKSVALKEHMAVHTGEDLYTCIYCAKMFKSNANMYAHRKKCAMKNKDICPVEEINA